MVEADYSPIRGLFVAAACGNRMIRGYWQGLAEFLKLVMEILITESPPILYDIFKKHQKRR
jgi:hypothetical protein